ncbi:MAG: HalD/BesD family halogenase [Dongiaceae bacterium]
MASSRVRDDGIGDILDLRRYPIGDLRTAEAKALVDRCKADLKAEGLFNLEGLVRPAAIERCAAELRPLIARESFTHRRHHNVYFLDDVAGLAPDHPALRKVETVNHTLCADQLAGSIINRIYEWTPLADFLAAVMEKPKLFLMDDPLARVNVMGYRAGETLNWHFDRSQFTTTLLIQAPEVGGEFQYRGELRSDTDPNYDGIARLLQGEDEHIRTLPLKPGTLNVFTGRNTLHRVSPPAGDKDRVIAIFSYYERPGVTFSDKERLGFYGRAC